VDVPNLLNSKDEHIQNLILLVKKRKERKGKERKGEEN